MRRLIVAVSAAATLVSCSGHPATVTLPSPSSTPTPTPTPTHTASPKPRSTVVTDCTAADLDVVLTSDRSSYARQQDVNFHTTATNTADHPCRTMVGACPDPVVVDDAQGHQVWTDTPPGFGACAALGGITLAPGASQGLSTEWDQRTCEPPGACPGGFVPPGTYAARGTWGTADGGAASDPLTITIT